jgi:putative permease
MQMIRDWFRRRFSDPQVVVLLVLILLGAGVLLVLGGMLAPVLASVVIAYLLEGPVGLLQRWKLPRMAAVLLVFLLFLVFLFFLLFGLLPLLWQQVVQLFQQLPSWISWIQRELMRLPELYPDFISEQLVLDLAAVLKTELTQLGQRILSLSVSSVTGIISILVYMILMPLMVFFFLKDKTRLFQWAAGLLPKERGLAREVWRDVNRKIGSYVRGKVWEIFIVWGVSYATFALLGLDFASWSRTSGLRSCWCRWFSSPSSSGAGALSLPTRRERTF